MNKKQFKILKRIFEQPTRTDIEFQDIENMMYALGFRKIEGRGSRITFQSSSGRIMFHRPHPQKETKTYAVDNLRKFLKQIGMTPESMKHEK